MRYNFLGRAGRAAQILGLVVISVFYSAQGLAYYYVDLTDGYIPDLTVSKGSNDTIEYYFSVNVADKVDSYTPEFRVSFSDTNQNSPSPQPAPSESLVINTLTNNSFIDSSLVTETEIKTPHIKNDFYLGRWSDYLSFSSVTSPHLVTFNMKFSRDQLWEWVSKSKKKFLDFYVVVHARHNIYADYPWSPPKYENSTSSLKVKIPIKRVEYAHIDGLQEVPLPQTNDMHFCVLSTTGAVGLKVEATNSTTVFQLEASDSETNAYTIGYDISLTGEIRGDKETIPVTKPGTVNGYRWDADLTKPSDINLCTGIENMSLRINFNDQTQADNAPPGEYKDTITITVSPV